MHEILLFLLIFACFLAELIPAEPLSRGPSGNYINTYNNDNIIESDRDDDSNNGTLTLSYSLIY